MKGKKIGKKHESAMEDTMEIWRKAVKSSKITGLSVSSLLV